MSDDSQLDIFAVHDVPHARTSDPDTSAAAGVVVEHEEGRTSTLRPGGAKHLALALIAESPCTAIEAERRSGRRGLWKRVSDLKNAQLVYDIGRRRDPLTEREGIVWATTLRGDSVLTQLDRGQEVRL